MQASIAKIYTATLCGYSIANTAFTPKQKKDRHASSMPQR